MFRELNTKHGNERPGKLQNLRTNCNLTKKGLKSHNLKKNMGQNEIKERLFINRRSYGLNSK